jgi:hypothetical protein
MKILFFLNLFNCHCWLRLLNFANLVVVAFFFNLLSVFAVVAYDSIAVIILLMFCSMFLNFLFIFLKFVFIIFSTINVKSNITTRRKKNNYKLESIIFAVLSRSKLWISFFICVFRLNKDKFVRAFCVFATSSRCLLNDDITSIFINCYALIRIKKRNCTSIFKAFKMWLFCFVEIN